jgi:hypothetical protein
MPLECTEGILVENNVVAVTGALSRDAATGGGSTHRLTWLTKNADDPNGMKLGRTHD